MRLLSNYHPIIPNIKILCHLLLVILARPHLSFSPVPCNGVRIDFLLIAFKTHSLGHYLQRFRAQHSTTWSGIEQRADTNSNANANLADNIWRQTHPIGLHFNCESVCVSVRVRARPMFDLKGWCGHSTLRLAVASRLLLLLWHSMHIDIARILLPTLALSQCRFGIERT